MISTSFGSALSPRRTGEHLVGMRAQLADLQRQLATGKRAETFGGLGLARGASLDLRAKLSSIEGHQRTIEDVGLRMKFMDASLSAVGKGVQETRRESLATAFTPGADGRTLIQSSSAERLRLAVDALNVEVGGRHLFSGRSTDVRPVESYDVLMNGDGAKAGLSRLIAERTGADLGTGGLGRLSTPSVTGSTVAVGRDTTNAGAMFGFDIAGVSSTFSNATLTGPSGANGDVSVAFTGQPEAGQSVSLVLDLPDGTKATVTLTARAVADPASLPQGEFAIGATPADTAGSLAVAMKGALGREAGTSLKASAAIVAAKDFFAGSSSAPPLRVQPVGGSPGAATDYLAGAAADTVIWYKGDDDPAVSARLTAPARIADNHVVPVGARANEAGLAQGLATFGALAAIDLAPADPLARARNDAIQSRVRTELSAPGGMQRVEDIQIELATANTAIAASKERHRAAAGVIKDSLQGIETPSNEELAASIMSLQTRLEASYETTGILSKLSLSQYI